MIDAKRMEVYTSFFDLNNNMKSKISAEIIDNESYKSILSIRKILFFGNGSEKCKGIITDDNAVFIENIYPSAMYMSELSFNTYNNKRFENTAYFEPFYLKDFITTNQGKGMF